MRLSFLHESSEPPYPWMENLPQRPDLKDKIMTGVMLAHIESRRANYYGGPFYRDGSIILFPHKRSAKLNRRPDYEAGMVLRTEWGELEPHCWCYSPALNIVFIMDANGVVRTEGQNQRHAKIEIYYLPIDATVEERTDDETGEVYEVVKSNRSKLPKTFKPKKEKPKPEIDKYKQGIIDRFKTLDIDDSKHIPPTRDEIVKDIEDDLGPRFRDLDLNGPPEENK